MPILLQFHHVVQLILAEVPDNKSPETIDHTNAKNKSINYYSDRHCTLSGRLLGIGRAITYLCAQGL